MNKEINLQKGDYSLSTEKNRLDIEAIHYWLSVESYWCKDVPLETVQRSIENSLCFGLYFQNKQAGFARVVTDFATVAYLGDVYILPEYRGMGHSKWMMDTIMSHPDLQNLRRWILLTRDAHELYKKYGWTSLNDSTIWMELHNKEVYVKQ